MAGGGMSKCNILWAVIVIAVHAIITSNAQICGPSEFLSNDTCVDECPSFHTANSTNGICDPFPSEFIARPTATVFSVELETASASGGTVNIPFTFIVDRDYFGSSFPDFTDIILTSVNSECTVGGLSTRFYPINAAEVTASNDAEYGPILTVTDNVQFTYSGPLSPGSHNCNFSIQLEPNGRNHQVSDFFSTSVIYEPGPCDSEPCTNGGTCNVEGESFSCTCASGFTGSTCEVVLDPCANDPCQNGATCVNAGGSNFMCSCPPDFTGALCDAVINDCEFPDLITCSNNGVCVDGNQTFSCNCDPGYTGSMCAEEIDECIGSGCLNGLCTDLLNDYTCSCYEGWTGRNCDTVIDYCVGSHPTLGPCDPVGSTQCTSGNSTFMCSCVIGFNGTLCDVDIDECQSDPCINGGNCTNLLFGQFTCNCVEGFSGSNCETDLEFCHTIQCLNGGSCVEGTGTAVSCDCITGFNGSRCEIDEDFCEPDKCLNGGTCVEGEGVATSCNCTEGFSGLDCGNEIPICQNVQCENGGTCVEGVGTVTTCNCVEGFSGSNCETDLEFCHTIQCLNGGSCVEGTGTAVSCDCITGFNGSRCEIDEDFCEPDQCLNGGMCVEGEGMATSCNCTEGFSGSDCENDDPFCQNVQCDNGGECVEGRGVITTCNCSEGFDGSRCEIDLDFCTNDTCLNGGTCTDGVGTATSCACARGYTGSNCSIDLSFCTNTTCMNGGTCVEGRGEMISCMCTLGYTGMMCDQDDGAIIVCRSNLCLNGGICVEEFGPFYSCNCTDGFSGPGCEDDLDFCSTRTCENGGTCVEGLGTNTSCNCTEGFSGGDCELDLNFCQLRVCFNNGTCEEGMGTATTCLCSPRYTGESCETDLCDSAVCLNGGTCEESTSGIQCQCMSGFSGTSCEEDLPFCQFANCTNGGVCVEGYGMATSCNCSEGFSGSQCENDGDFCSLRNCQNGGTCEEGVGPATSCNCPPGYTGENCEMALCDSLPCMNDGFCQVTPNGAECNCTVGFSGQLCEVDLDFCDIMSPTCMNGGICIEDVGALVLCNCSFGFSGERCEDDDEFCFLRDCRNGGTCIEGVGPFTQCNCRPRYTGTDCETDLCDSLPCLNGGSCQETDVGVECRCAPGYGGTFCQDDLDYCSSDTCFNGGTCIEGIGNSTSCNCSEGFSGPRCENDDPFCHLRNCQNGGTCVEGTGSATTCSCTPRYTGDSCEIDRCDSLTCQNGGTCQEVSTGVECNCPPGFSGMFCESDLDFCQETSCMNGGTCIEGYGTNTSCNCTLGFSGERCNVDDDFCHTRNCENGGTCVEGIGPATSCSCVIGFTGENCESLITCRANSDCPTDFFCEVMCPSDNYTNTHTTLLSEPLNLRGVSFLTVPESRRPTITPDISLFAVFRQEPGNRGYVFFHGTSPESRNFAVLIDATVEQSENSTRPGIYVYYTSSSFNVSRLVAAYDMQVTDNATHTVAITMSTSVNPGSARIFLDGNLIGETVHILRDPDLQRDISATNPAVTLVGARLQRNFRFVGEIGQVVVFAGILSRSNISDLHAQYAQLLQPQGTCTRYMPRDSSCPTPRVSSLLCQSIYSLCQPGLACLPNFDNQYSCQPLPFECSSDSDCPSDYLCGSALPGPDKSQYDNPGANIAGDVIFLQRDSMTFDGYSLTSLPVSSLPPLMTDLTIFATVCQEEGNDGYVIGKGVNDRMRDFGLYLRSSKRTVWLAYGASNTTDGFQHILFFYDVSVADGSCHSVSAVIDSASDKAVLYIDGQAVGITSPLPGVPDFRNNFNFIYVGGRPSTRHFRFQGSISNLFVGSSSLPADTIASLHRQSITTSGVQLLTLSNSSVRYCFARRRLFEECYVDSISNNNFKCESSFGCVPSFSNSESTNLPEEGGSYRIAGRCVDPCSACSAEVNPQCGEDGRTYQNRCFLDCVNVQFLHSGRCLDYSDLYTRATS